MILNDLLEAFQPQVLVLLHWSEANSLELHVGLSKEGIDRVSVLEIYSKSTNDQHTTSQQQKKRKEKKRKKIN